MPEPSPPSDLRGNLRRIYADGVAFSVMVGTGETYLAAFVLALGMGELAAGLIASVPLLAGAIIQLISPAAVRHLGSHKKWVVLCAFTQAVSFAPLIVAAMVGQIHMLAVFAIAALYWGSGMATGPAWNTWVGTLVPQRIRASYFANRSRATHFSVLVGLILGGLALQYGDSKGHSLTAFAMLFGIAAVCRFVSAVLLAQQTEPEPPDADHRIVPMRELTGRFRKGSGGRLLTYMLGLQVAVQISGPYFTPYMLKQLELTYASYLLLIATSYSARIVMLPMLGGLVRSIGPHRVLWYAGVGIIPLSAMWIVSDSLVYLFFVQITAGAVWAAYELATFLLLFETIREEERTSVLTTFNLANALAMVGGSLLGGTILTALGTDKTSYLWLFGISGVVRIFTLVLLVPAVRTMPLRLPLEPVPVPTRVVAVRPNFGAFERPVLPGIAPEVATAEVSPVEESVDPTTDSEPSVAATSRQAVSN